MPEFVRVTDPNDPAGVAFTTSAAIAKRGGFAVLDEPATRADGKPLPPAPLPKKKNPGQKADTDKEK